jgi:hypothetical protein
MFSGIDNPRAILSIRSVPESGSFIAAGSLFLVYGTDIALRVQKWSDKFDLHFPFIKTYWRVSREHNVRLTFLWFRILGTGLLVAGIYFVGFILGFF